jgi:hypothetical protein
VPPGPTAHLHGGFPNGETSAAAEGESGGLLGDR